MKLRDYSLRHFIEKSKLKREVKTWLTIHVCHLALPFTGSSSLSAVCSFSAILSIVLCFFYAALDAAAAALSLLS